MLSAAAPGLVASNPGGVRHWNHRREGAEDAGLLPYEIFTHIDGAGCPGNNEFSEQMGVLSSGEEVVFTVVSHPDLNGDRSEREITVTLGDRYEYYVGLCGGDSACVEEPGGLLVEMGVENGDAFLGVSGLRSSSSSVDYYSSKMSGEYPVSQSALGAALTPLAMIGVPIQHDGQTMLLEERAMLKASDGALPRALGTAGMLILFDFLFWLVWINFLLGFANLIPMVPFDGGHIVKDGVHSILSRLTSGIHPMRVELMAERISRGGELPDSLHRGSSHYAAAIWGDYSSLEEALRLSVTSSTR
ncbi:MAG: hypothetical protein Ct9H300mP30_2990 [Methanobacteriota archaeon]|nr:MAG: hypothetical protein Ct9H300mP30_2990 [Euryarchaeota archaeon]